MRVSPMKGVQRFGVKGKLAPRYVGPFPIIERCGPVAYRLKLPAQLSAVHNIFHVSQLRKCLRVPEKVIDIEKLQLEPDLVYPEYQSKLLITRPGSLGIKPVTSIRCNGVITPSGKLLGRRRNLFGLNVRNCYKLIEVHTNF